MDIIWSKTTQGIDYRLYTYIYIIIYSYFVWTNVLKVNLYVINVYVECITLWIENIVYLRFESLSFFWLKIHLDYRTHNEIIILIVINVALWEINFLQEYVSKTNYIQVLNYECIS